MYISLYKKTKKNCNQNIVPYNPLHITDWSPYKNKNISWGQKCPSLLECMYKTLLAHEQNVSLFFQNISTIQDFSLQITQTFQHFSNVIIKIKNSIMTINFLSHTKQEGPIQVCLQCIIASMYLPWRVP